jgi:2-polyprenyl-3-methyl-5-hydroxy-6-metoxy-1,4-benzoquinol methylase
MALRIDPERNEVRALKRVTDWRGKRILEIGCGDGRLTRRLARLGARVQAIDPDVALIRTARRRTPPSFSPRVTHRVGRAGRLDYAAGSFGVVLFSWAL